MARKKELVPVIGVRGKPQMQQLPPRGWTRDKEKRFLEVLGETCNVTRACEAVGMSPRGTYLRRGRNAAFRAAWMETLSAAYQRLELVLIERTLNGTEKVMTRRDGSEDRMREYPNGLGLALLKMHRAKVPDVTAPAQLEDVDEVRERLVKKLLRLKARSERLGRSFRGRSSTGSVRPTRAGSARSSVN